VERKRNVQVNYEFITGIALGIENFLDEEDETDAWIISIFILGL